MISVYHKHLLSETVEVKGYGTMTRKIFIYGSGGYECTFQLTRKGRPHTKEISAMCHGLNEVQQFFGDKSAGAVNVVALARFIELR